MDRDVNFPYLSRVSSVTSEDGTSFLDKLFRDLFLGNAEALKSIELKAEKGDGKESLKALAFAMTGERVSVEKVGSIYKCCINLSGQILILDFETMMVVGSYPLIWEIVQVYDNEPNSEDICGLLMSDQYGLQSEFFKQPIIDTLSTVGVKDNAGRTLRVLTVDINDKVIPFLSEDYANNLPAYKAWIAEQCGVDLSSEKGLALLPYAKDAANANMALAFANSEILMFTIPAPTYGISISLDQFKKVVAKETLAERLLVYGAYVTLKIYEPQFGKVYYENPVKKGIPKTVPASQEVVDDFAVFQEALKNVLQKAGNEAMNDKKGRKVLEKCKRS